MFKNLFLFFVLYLVLCYYLGVNKFIFLLLLFFLSFLIFKRKKKNSFNGIYDEIIDLNFNKKSEQKFFKRELFIEDLVTIIPYEDYIKGKKIKLSEDEKNAIKKIKENPNWQNYFN